MYQFTTVHAIPMALTRLYPSWLETEQLRRWLVPPDAHLTELLIEAIIGGRYRIGYDHATQGHIETPLSVEIDGHYRIILPPSYLLMSWHWRPDPQTTLLEVKFRPLGRDSSEILLSHSAFADRTSRDRQRQFWREALTRLQNL